VTLAVDVETLIDRIRKAPWIHRRDRRVVGVSDERFSRFGRPFAAAFRGGAGLCVFFASSRLACNAVIRSTTSAFPPSVAGRVVS
jgi:hypothetical protein